MSAATFDTTSVQRVKVRAVREPLSANVWSIVDETTGIEIAGLRIDDLAGAKAYRIANALNAQLAG